MENNGICVRFRLSDDEARRATADLQAKMGGAPWSRRFYLIFGALIMAYGLLEPVLWHEGGRHWSFVLSGGSYLLFAALQTWGGGSVAAGVETFVRFDEAGVSSEGSTSLIAPWRAVRSASDRDDLITVNLRATLRHPGGRHIAIPKRVLPDGGVALWQLLDGALPGTQMLVRSRHAATASPRSVRIISNTRC